MKLTTPLISTLLLLSTRLTQAASSWKFSEAIISISGKGGSASLKDKLSDHVPLSKPVHLGANENLKIVITATENAKAKRPHQAFLLLRDQVSGLESTFPFQMKENGKGKVDVTQKDLPVQLLLSSEPLRATILIASFGDSIPFANHVFDLEVVPDVNVARPKYEKAVRFGKLPEIHHIFRADPKSGPVIISVFFVMAILATVPVLLGTWLYLGANLNHLQKAASTAPVSHAVFFSSIVAMEGVFLLYYYKWSLFQMVPIAGIVGLVASYSGSKALSEVQARRMAGER